MTNDDWDSVSDTTPPNSATDPSDAVSTPQPSTRRRRVVPDDLMPGNLTASQQDTPVTPPSAPHWDASSTSSTRQTFISAPLSSKAAIFGVVLLLILAGSFGVFQGISIHNANVTATATAEAEATTAAYANATATVQAVATATTLQEYKQIYIQATSGTPAVDDPLSDNRNNWALLNADWGGTCAFTGGAYHLGLAKPGYWVFCDCACTNNLSNFAIQTQISIMQGNEGGVIFGLGAPSAYRIYIDTSGNYVMYMQTNGQDQTLLNGSSFAVKTGLNQDNVITAIVSNNNFYFWVNNQFVASVALDAYNQGNVGFAASSMGQTTGTDVAYSNTKVWRF